MGRGRVDGEFMPARRYHIIFNPQAGTALAMGLTTAVLSEHFERAGIDFVIDDDDHVELAERLSRALASDAEIVVAAGGDGAADLPIIFGRSFRSPMPHRLEAMKYKHKPLATL